ncbi:hypothetical protein [Massilia scottii]|uniref:hypothetical protein n=2 Tax=Massilia TaxID=149698 RepID=UPI0027966850|nr:hypothetical protein [Massilia sp. CCM 9029]MDQ1834664.1 hypothetical protein [Massilia sp. CCM 9029]MDQ1835275.1 hypothetical protein [Massilia sp. CCM 9029]
MSNLKKYALIPTAVHQLRDGNDELMFADGADGKPDPTKPMNVHVFGPGTKVYAKAKAAQANRNMDRYKKKGKSDLSAEDQTKDTADFLAAVTDRFENIEVDELTDKALFMAVYSDLEVCFIPAQLDKLLSDTANFTKASPTA